MDLLTNGVSIAAIESWGYGSTYITAANPCLGDMDQHVVIVCELRLRPVLKHHVFYCSQNKRRVLLGVCQLRL